jgi:ABC-2 type transport system ATP-binding protein
LILAVNNIEVVYDHVILVLKGVSLEVPKGGIVALLGANGAGKTTTIHMLATLLKPTSGSATVNGYDIVSQPAKVRSSIGIVFQAPSSDDILTGYENLHLHSMLYSVPRHIRKKRIEEVLELVGLAERKDDPVKTYSGGMRRRLEIARGLLHKPKVMFLDEPTLGLDPASREVMWRYVRRLVEEEKITVILTTHYMEEADMLCDRIAIIDKGKVVALDTPAGLKAGLGGDIIRIKTKDPSALKLVRGLDFVSGVEQSDGFLVLSVNDAKKALPVLLQQVEAESAEFSSPTLNDVFIKITGRKIDKEQAEGGFMERYAKYD